MDLARLRMGERHRDLSPAVFLPCLLRHAVSALARARLHLLADGGVRRTQLGDDSRSHRVLPRQREAWPRPCGSPCRIRSPGTAALASRATAVRANAHALVQPVLLHGVGRRRPLFGRVLPLALPGRQQRRCAWHRRRAPASQALIQTRVGPGKILQRLITRRGHIPTQNIETPYNNSYKPLSYNEIGIMHRCGAIALLQCTFSTLRIQAIRSRS